MLTKLVIGLKLLIAAGILTYVVAHWADLSAPPTVGDLKDIGVVGLVFGVPPVFALVRAAFIILPIVIMYAAGEALLRGVRTFKIGKEGVEIGLVERATQTAEEALQRKDEDDPGSRTTVARQRRRGPTAEKDRRRDACPGHLARAAGGTTWRPRIRIDESRRLRR